MIWTCVWCVMQVAELQAELDRASTLRARSERETERLRRDLERVRGGGRAY